MYSSESSTKRFFNKLKRPFQRPSDYYYFDQQNFGPVHPGENINPKVYPTSNKAEKTHNNKLSIIPFLKNAGLDVNKLNPEVIDVLNRISIDDDLNVPQQQKDCQETKENINKVCLEEQGNFTSGPFFSESNPMFEYKNDMLLKQSCFSPSEIQYKDKNQNKFKDAKINGNFEHFSSDLLWNERKRQLKFKDLAKNDIVSESILKNIDEIIKTNNKQYKQITNLVVNFEKYVNTKNKVYLKPESEQIIEDFIKIFNVKGYNKVTENEILSFLQNFIFGIYIREGTLKKCHSNVLSAKINGEFASKNNDVDVNFYYEEFQKIQSNFVEDSKNYSDYISEEGSLFILNMIASNQQYSSKEESCHNKIYSNIFDHLYKQYPQEMLDKLLEYSLKFQVCNWSIFEKFLIPDKNSKNALNVNSTNKFDENSLIAKREVDKLSTTKLKKSLNKERRIKQLPARQSLSLDNTNVENQLFENQDIVNTQANNPSSSYLNSESNKQPQVNGKNSSKLENQVSSSLYKAENLETGTAVDPSNKENFIALTIDKKLESPKSIYATKILPFKSLTDQLTEIPRYIQN
ncbi:hypothetical protein FOG50_01536 [Hanseniaspora uvarum]|nr:hypothetical protein FOG50_01536 [Hanseniaspora uvarum]